MEELDQAIEYLKKEYQEAVKRPWVRNPLAYALYMTWAQYDMKAQRRTEDD